jgi:alpha-tubulin suppressor-like RCC1 family protein
MPVKFKNSFFITVGNIFFLVSSATASSENLSRKKRSVIWENFETYHSISMNNSSLCGIKQQSNALVCFQLFKDGSRIPPNESIFPGEYSKISLGGEQSCVINKSDQSISCWNKNIFAQEIGKKTFTPILPNKIESNKKFVNIASGTKNTYAIDNQGALYGWGENSRGQLANLNTDFTNDMIPKLSSTPVNIHIQGKTFFSIATGDQFFCTISNEGNVESIPYGKLYCAGDNSQGQIGSGENSKSAIGKLTQISSKNYLSVSAGKYHACAITENHQLECWGSNYFGQLGFNPAQSENIYSPRLVTSSSVTFNNAKIQSVTLNDNSTCVLTKEGTPYCFGDNSFGQIGSDPKEDSIPILDPSGNTYHIRFEPRIPFPNWNISFLNISGNSRTTCGMTTENKLECWGFFEKNKYRALSVGYGNKCGISLEGDRLFCSSKDTTPQSHPNPWNTPLSTPWASSQSFKQVSVGRYQTCAVTKDHGPNTYCWTNPKTSYFQWEPYPQLVTSLNEENSKIVVNTNHACAIRKRDGALLCSGENAEGQLGNGTRTGTSKLVDFVEVQAKGISFIDVALTENSTCAISTDHDVYCFGSNAYGEVGINNPFPYAKGTPKKLSNLTLKSISGDFRHFCGIVYYATEMQNKVVCWGSNSEGQTGQNIYTKNIKPVELNRSANIKSVVVKNETTCTLDKENSVHCFGSNINALIPERAQSAPAHIPVHVQKDKKFKEISIGDKEACGISVLDNTVQCWGNN